RDCEQEAAAGKDRGAPGDRDSRRGLWIRLGHGEVRSLPCARRMCQHTPHEMVPIPRGGARQLRPGRRRADQGGLGELVRRARRGLAARPRPARAAPDPPRPGGGGEPLPPIEPRVLYAAGPNYRGHLEGMARRRGEAPKYPGRPEPKLRSVNAIIATEENIVVPRESTGAVQPEGQLAIVIGKKARNVSREEALDCVLGYTIGNDVSQREGQKTERS